MTEYGLIVILVVLDVYQSVMLTLEHYWGRPDMAVKNEAKQRKRLKEKPSFDALTQGEGK